MATIRDVAKLADVSIATVSRVLNNKPNISQTAIDAVYAAIKELNYTSNRTKPSKKSSKGLNSPLGVLVADVSNSFFGQIVKATDQVARKNQRSLLITNGYHNAQYEKEALELLIEHGCQAMVVHCKALSDEALRSYAAQIPGLVFINRLVTGFEQRCVYLNNLRGSQNAVQHLINKGHKHIAYLGSSHNIEDAADRIRGFQIALETNGLPNLEENIILAEPDDVGGAEAMSNLLAKNNPITAVAAYNDFMASGAISVLRENGIRIPEDISIIGFDDSNIAKHVQPKLSSVRYPIQIMSEQAAKLALALSTQDCSIKGSSVNRSNNEYIPTLVQRNSILDLGR